MRIYLNPNTKQVFLDNEEPRFAESYINAWDGEYFQLWKKGNTKRQFREHWSNIFDEQGNGFASLQLTIDYLNGVFKAQIVGTHEEYGQPDYDFELDITTLLTF